MMKIKQQVDADNEKAARRIASGFSQALEEPAISNIKAGINQLVGNERSTEGEDYRGTEKTCCYDSLCLL